MEFALKTKGKAWGEILSRKSFYYFFLCTVHSYNHALLYYFLFRVDGCGMVKVADFGLSKSTIMRNCISGKTRVTMLDYPSSGLLLSAS